jgi:hypothetical protein
MCILQQQIVNKKKTMAKTIPKEDKIRNKNRQNNIKRAKNNPKTERQKRDSTILLLLRQRETTENPRL